MALQLLLPALLGKEGARPNGKAQCTHPLDGRPDYPKSRNTSQESSSPHPRRLRAERRK